MKKRWAPMVRVRDVTRRLQAEREVERQRSLSLRSDRLRSLGEMAAGIAHESNQPLVGKLTLQSTPGEGTTATIILPIAEDQSANLV